MKNIDIQLSIYSTRKIIFVSCHKPINTSLIFACKKNLKRDKLELTGRFLTLTDQEFTFSVEEDIREYLLKNNKYQVKDSCSSSKQNFDNKRYVRPIGTQNRRTFKNSLLFVTNSRSIVSQSNPTMTTRF